jgi:hypothetical protein
MISMGLNTGNAHCPGVSVYNDCNAVIIEHLGLNANSQPNVIGIANYYSQELSRVNDVSITGIGSGGIGLDLSGGNSGPYSNISVSGAGGLCPDQRTAGNSWPDLQYKRNDVSERQQSSFDLFGRSKQYYRGCHIPRIVNRWDSCRICLRSAGKRTDEH